MVGVGHNKVRQFSQQRQYVLPGHGNQPTHVCHNDNQFTSFPLHQAVHWLVVLLLNKTLLCDDIVIYKTAERSLFSSRCCYTAVKQMPFVPIQRQVHCLSTPLWKFILYTQTHYRKLQRCWMGQQQGKRAYGGSKNLQNLARTVASIQNNY